MRDFFDRYVWDSQHLPIAEYYGKLGIRLIERRDGTAERFEIDSAATPAPAGAQGGLAGPKGTARQLEAKSKFWVYRIGRPWPQEAPPMLARFASIATALALSAAPLAAQAPAPLSACDSDALCGAVPKPIGLYIRGVEEGGRYLTLEDGTSWEVEISDRATTASWAPDDFVNLSWISAPRGDFQYLLTRPGDREQRAAARSGRPTPRPRRSGVVAAEVGGETVEVGEQPPLVHTHQVELVPEPARLPCRDHEPGQRRAEAVRLEEADRTAGGCPSRG